MHPFLLKINLFSVQGYYKIYYVPDNFHIKICSPTILLGFSNFSSVTAKLDLERVLISFSFYLFIFLEISLISIYLHILGKKSKSINYKHQNDSYLNRSKSKKFTFHSSHFIFFKFYVCFYIFVCTVLTIFQLSLTLSTILREIINFLMKNC